MRIVLVVPAFPKLSETFIVSKALGLLERGVDVQIVCRTSAEEEWAHFSHLPGMAALRGRVHRQPTVGRRPADLARLMRAAGGAIPAHGPRRLRDGSGSVRHRMRDLAVDATILGLRPDLVHFEFGTLAREFAARRRLLDVPLTVSFRGFDLAYAGLGDPDHYREVWENVDAVHVLAASQWERARRRGAPAGLSHTVISPALDVDAVEPATSRPDPVGTATQPLRLLSVGRLHWKKGYDHVLDAVARLVRGGLAVEHRIVGDGVLFEALHFWRRQLGLDGAVEIVGAVGPDEIAHHLRWADVFVQGSVSEGFCNAVVEAQAHGVPVVATDADGLRDNVDDGRTGDIVPRRDPVALADAIARLAADSDRRAAMGAAGIERVATEFRIEDQIDAWIAFYEETLANPRHQPSLKGRSRR